MPPATNLTVHILDFSHLLFDKLALKAFNAAVYHIVEGASEQKKSYNADGRQEYYHTNYYCNFHNLSFRVQLNKLLIYIFIKPP